MPFLPNDPRTAELSARGVAARQASPESYVDATATARAARYTKYASRARAQFASLGIIPTEADVQAAAHHLLAVDMRERSAKGNAVQAARATERMVAAQRAGFPQDPWLNRVVDLGIAFADRLADELPANPYSPKEQRRWLATILRVVLSAVRDEYDRGPAREFQNVSRRWEDYRLYLHERECPQRLYADTCCLVCGEPGTVAA